GQRLVRFIFEILDAAALVVIAHQADERRDRAVARAGLGELIDERLKIEHLAGDRYERDRHTLSIATASARSALAATASSGIGPCGTKAACRRRNSTASAQG